MDIARPDLKKQKQRRLILWAGIGVVVLTVAVVLVSRLKPAAPVVDASAVWPDTVKRGDMIRQVRGSTGLLVPREDSIELIPALTDATVVRIRVLPGTIVKPDTILMDMAAPEVEQKLLDAQLQVKAAEADYKDKQATLNGALMEKKIAAAQVATDASTDERQAKIDEQLTKLGVMAGVAYEKSRSTADQLAAQHKLSLQNIELNEKNIEVQLSSAQTKIDQAKACSLSIKNSPAPCRLKLGFRAW